ncbi:hypothetical protein TcYC6_0120780 [Trypanosoma cruzi]|nr:hypothetical protein TcYC6_0120780 [Trypanosoma cruzi]
MSQGTPPVMLCNVIENPAWCTPYTPFQAEITQGRLESLLNFQSMIIELTAMNLANASLLDQATACAEAMYLAFHHGRKERMTFFIIIEGCLPILRRDGENES